MHNLTLHLAVYNFKSLIPYKILFFILETYNMSNRIHNKQYIKYGLLNHTACCNTFMEGTPQQFIVEKIYFRNKSYNKISYVIQRGS